MKHNIESNESKINRIIDELKNLKNNNNQRQNINEKTLQAIFRKHPKNDNGLFSKSDILKGLNELRKTHKISATEYEGIKSKLIMKKTRTVSGVTPVTVLTKPFPCPGQCIFCPNDVRMPKSYLSDEPGAQRAFKNKFDPYQQTFNRLLAYKNIGHPTDKVELIILGGTWSAYPNEYQIWFIKRCFDAMNDFDPDTEHKLVRTDYSLPYDEGVIKNLNSNSNNTKEGQETYNTIVSKAIRNIRAQSEVATWDELTNAQKQNETSKTRCIGLVVETRPDEITEEEVIKIRKLGATKVQLGVQSLNEDVLQKNKRGHTVETTKKAFALLRKAGFKIHIHWMPNLYGSNPQKDIEDYHKLFKQIDFRPDEIKIYPCSLIESAELYEYYKNGLWKPYTEEELLQVLSSVMLDTPRYCRISRMIRDIGSQDIVVGNKKTNFRQIVELKMRRDKKRLVEIRAREIRDTYFDESNIKLRVTEYETNVSNEYFLEYITRDDRILGFLRLSLPLDKEEHFIDELRGKGIIREIHVYGPSLSIGKSPQQETQHLGLGTKLINHAKKIARKSGFSTLAVISSIGTREYYRHKGFVDGVLYQFTRT